jgi:acyl-CoA thioesterase
VGNLDSDTRLDGAGGHYRAQLSPDWKIWGPNGGYLAAIALRAAGAESRLPRPASFACQFLGVGRFDSVEVHVEVLRRGRGAEALRVAIEQEGRSLLSAQVWTVGEAAGPELPGSVAPTVAPAEQLASLEELLGPEQGSVHPFWGNLERRPTEWVPPAERRPGEPCFRSWFRFRPQARFDDPFLDAARALILLDTMSWPAYRAGHPDEPSFIAPSLDVAAQFHELAPGSDWLLCETHADVARDGLIGYRSRVWSSGRRLLASGGGQLLCRSLPATTPSA